jgi:hypothetical protein
MDSTDSTKTVKINIEIKETQCCICDRVIPRINYGYIYYHITPGFVSKQMCEQCYRGDSVVSLLRESEKYYNGLGE